MRADVIDRDMIVGLADRPRKAGARRGERPETHMRERLRRSDIKGIGDDEATTFVQLAERCAFLGQTVWHVCSPCWRHLLAKTSCASGGAPELLSAGRHLSQKSPFLGENEFVFLGKREIRFSLFIGPQACAVLLVSGQKAMLLVPSCGIQ